MSLNIAFTLHLHNKVTEVFTLLPEQANESGERAEEKNGASKIM